MHIVGTGCTSCVYWVLPAPERRSSITASACDDVENARWQAYVMRNGGHLQTGEAAELRGLQNAAVACCQCWRHLPLHVPNHTVSQSGWLAEACNTFFLFSMLSDNTSDYNCFPAWAGCKQ